MTLRQQLAGLVLVATLPILGALAYAVVAARKSAGESARATTGQLAALNAASLGEFIADRRANLRAIASRPLVARADGDRCDPFLREALTLHRYYANTTVIALDGQVVCSALPSSAGSLPDVADTAWFRKLRRTGRFTVGDPYLGRTSGRRVAVLAMPLRDRGRRTGYLTMGVDLVRLQALVAGQAMASGALLSVVSGDGAIVTRSVDSARWVGRRLSETARVDVGRSKVVSAGDGVRRITAAARIPGTSWIATAGIPLDVAYAASDRLTRTLVLISVGVVVLALLVAMLISRRIADPVQRQRRRAEGQLSQRARQQDAVARLSQLALGERELEALAREIVATVASTLDVQVCGIMRLRPDEDVFDMLAGIGFRGGPEAYRAIPAVPGSRAAYALGRHAPVVVDDLTTGAPFPLDRHLADQGVVSGMRVAVPGRDRPFGLLGAHATQRRVFDVDDVNFLTAVANVLSAAVERQRDEENSRHAALHDALTGLPNRTLAVDRLEHALRRRARHGTDVAVLMVDLDRFKVINDSLGHAAGDEVLRELAPRLCATLRPHDTVARLSGDEFAVICDGPAGTRDVIAVAERVAAAISRPFVLDSGEHFLTASIGIAVAASDRDTAASLLRDADAAMYQAKKDGPGRHEVFDDAMRAHVITRLRTETELRRAIDRDELRVYYQPIVDVEGGRPVAVEAVVRWEHPDRGIVVPADFIPTAEETGLVVELGRWVLGEACRQGAAWQQRSSPGLQMSVNVSARQVVNPLFAAEVAEIARRSGLAPGTLALEVTESVLIEEAESHLSVLRALREHDLCLVLDDFGTGYSSLSYLKNFPLDGLKIDRSFMAGLGQSPKDTAIMRAAIEMARALGISVVAEGVETEEQLRLLRRLRCGRVQGYLFSEPRPAPVIGEYLAEHAATASPTRP